MSNVTRMIRKRWGEKRRRQRLRLVAWGSKIDPRAHRANHLTSGDSWWRVALADLIDRRKPIAPRGGELTRRRLAREDARRERNARGAP